MRAFTPHEPSGKHLVSVRGVFLVRTSVYVRALERYSNWDEAVYMWGTWDERTVKTIRT